MLKVFKQSSAGGGRIALTLGKKSYFPLSFGLLLFACMVLKCTIFTL
jgi:hypothetical protein